MTPQEIYDTVVRHLLSQGRRSIAIGDDACLYRGPNGFKCAIGCLIPDEMYAPEMEGGDVVALLGEFPAVAALFGRESEQLLLELQVAHDYDRCWDADGFSREGREHMREIARDHDLSTAVLDAPT